MDFSSVRMLVVQRTGARQLFVLVRIIVFFIWNFQSPATGVSTPMPLWIMGFIVMDSLIVYFMVPGKIS